VVVVQVLALQRVVTQEDCFPGLVAQMREMEHRKHLAPQEDLELVRESTGPLRTRCSPLGSARAVPER
jgi:hypothetical protein